MRVRSSAPAVALVLVALTGCGAKKVKVITTTVTTTASTGADTSSTPTETTSTATTPSSTTTTTPTSSGGGGSAAYQDKIRVLGTAFQQQVARTQGKVASAVNNTKRVEVLGEFGSEFSGLAAKLDAVKPPSRAQAAQDRLVALLRKGAGDIKKVQAAIKAKSVSAIRSSSAKFQKDAITIQAALQALKTAVG